MPGLDVRAGQTIAGKYRVKELLGHGPSGVVLAARNVHLREQVVLKILASYTDGQEELLQRRLKKARIASRLKSEHVARIVDIGVTADGMSYVATEALDGTTLEAELAERGMLPVEEAARWVLEACEGLAEAHAAGLVHGDLKPQNIFLARSGDTRTLKILDFGSTSPLDAIGDQSASAFFGSPAFVAPEQIQSPADVDARADVWALGVLLYNLVSGQLPFVADTLSGVIVAVVYDAPSLLTDAPYELARLVARCLEKDPANRPQDVRELAAALDPFAGSEGARLSERVQAMLDAGSMAPITIGAIADSADDDAFGAERISDEPLPLVTLRATGTGTGAARPRAELSTRPSARVIARRQSRTRTAVLAALGGAAAIALASWATTRSPSLPEMSAAAPAEVSITSAPIGTSIAATNPSELPDAPRAIDANDAGASAPTPEPEVSFAPASSDGVTATPLAMTPTPLATSEPLPPTPTLPFPSPEALADAPAAPVARPAAPPVVLPAPRSFTPSSFPNVPSSPRVRPAPPSARVTTPLRLPPGLPTTREALSPPPRSDETYLRKLISDRK